MSDKDQVVKWLHDAADRIEAGKLSVYHSNMYEAFGFFELYVKAEAAPVAGEK